MPTCLMMYFIVRSFSQKDSEKCNIEDKTKDGEDVEIGKCLRNLGVSMGDSRDGKQRDRFFPFPIGKRLLPRIPHDAWSHDKLAWYHQATPYPTKQVKQVIGKV